MKCDILLLFYVFFLLKRLCSTACDKSVYSYDYYIAVVQVLFTILINS